MPSWGSIAYPPHCTGSRITYAIPAKGVSKKYQRHGVFFRQQSKGKILPGVAVLLRQYFCGRSVPTIAASTAAGDAGKFPGSKPFSVLANDQFRAFSTTHVEAWQVWPAIGFAGVVPTQIHAPTDRVGTVGLATVWSTAMQCE